MKRTGDFNDPNPKRQKTFNKSDFILDEAEEDGVDVLGGYSDDDLDQDQYDPEGIGEVEPEQETDVTEYQRLLNQEKESGMSASDRRLQELTEKYGKWTEMEKQAEAEGHQLSMAPHEIGRAAEAAAGVGYGDLEGEEGEGSRFMPNLIDPKLWMVQCKYGFERNAVQKLMTKFVNLLNKPDKALHILSAFTTDQNIGWIYVEAFREVHVSRAVEGVEGLNMWKIKLVTIKDMTSALQVKMTTPTVDRGQWVRMKASVYKNDLAQVWKIRDMGSKLIVKLVPRIDITQISTGGSGFRPFGRYQTAPPQKAFNSEEIQGLGGEVHQEMDQYLGRNVWKFRNQSYYKGFHLKTVDVNKVQFDVSATREEVAPFRRNLIAADANDSGDEEEEELWNVPLPAMKRHVEFKRDDTVKVTSGPLKNLTGKVLTTTVNADGKTIVAVMPNYDGLVEPLDFEAEILKKFFSVGSQVKVLHGNYKGETGLIVSVDEEDDKLTIFSDMTSKEIQALADDVIETTEVSGGRDTYGRFKLHDLVRMSNERVGVIVQIQTGQFTILDTKGDLQNVRINEIIGIISDKHTVALDRNGDQVQVDDVVLPVTGQWRGERCTVKHVYRITLFLHIRQCMENAGVFVLPSRQSVSAGNQKPKRGKDSRAKSLRLNGSAIMMTSKDKKRDPWIGQTVKITKGSWKGYLGIVKATTDRHLQVELHAKLKTVNIRRQCVKKTDKHGGSLDGDDGSRSTPGSTTPFGSRTPKFIGSQTPMYGSSTPFLGSATPMQGNQTPMYGGMTPRAHETPRYGGETPGYGGATPGYGGATPAYAQTPAYETPRYDGSATPNVGNATPAYEAIGTPAHYSGTPSGSQYGSVGTPFQGASPFIPGGPDTPMISPGSSNTPANMNNYAEQAFTNNSESMFTPNQPMTPQPAYDPSDMSDTQDPKSSFSPVTNFGDENYSFSETGEDQLSTSDIGVSDPRNSDSMTHTDSGNENTAQRQAPKDAFYFIIPDAKLKYQDEACLVKEILENNEVRIELESSGQITTVPKDALTYTLPKEGDNVKVVVGAVAGETGELLGIDGDDAIVKMSTTYEIQILPRDSMVKTPAVDKGGVF